MATAVPASPPIETQPEDRHDDGSGGRLAGRWPCTGDFPPTSHILILKNTYLIPII
jgi:hypothetical protein